MLARYSSEDGLKFFWNKSNTGGWKNPFGNINWNGNIKASVMPELTGLDKITSVEILGNSLDDLREKYSLTEGAGLNFVHSVKDGNVSLKTGETALQGFQRGLVATSVKTKAATIAMKALSTIGWMALIAGISAVISKVSSLYSEMRETRQEAIQLGKDTKSAEDNLGKLIKQYQKLGTDGKIDNSDREQAQSIQEQIVELVGDENDELKRQAEQLNLINGSYDVQLEKLKKISLEQAKKNTREYNEAKVAAEDELASEAGWTFSGSGKNQVFSLSRDDKYFDFETTFKDLEKKVYDTFKEQGIEGKRFDGVGVYQFSFDKNNTDQVLAVYEALEKTQEILYADYGETIIDSSIYTDIGEKLKKLKPYVDAYKESLENYNLNSATVKFNETKYGGTVGANVQNETEMGSYIKAVLNSGETDEVKTEILNLATVAFPKLSEAARNAAREFYGLEKAEDGTIKATGITKDNFGDVVGSLDRVSTQCGITTGALAEALIQLVKLGKVKLDPSQIVSYFQQIGAAIGVALGTYTDEELEAKGAVIRPGKRKKTATDDAVGIIIDGVWHNYGTAAEKQAVQWLYTFKDNQEAFKSNINTEVPNYPTDTSKSDKKSAFELEYERHQHLLKMEQETDEQYFNWLKNAYVEAYKKGEIELDDFYKYEEECYEKSKALYEQKINSITNGIDLAKNKLKDIVNVFESGSAEKFAKDIDDGYKKIQEIAHSEANRYRALGYKEDSPQIQEQQKQWWDAEEKRIADKREIFDARLQQSEDYISEQEILGWKNGDSEVEARWRMLEWISSDVYKSMIEDEDEYNKIRLEHLKNYNDAVKDDLDNTVEVYNKLIDSMISRHQGVLDIMNKEHDAINSLKEAQHEADKAIADSRISKEYLNDHEYSLIYNEDDYAKITRTIDDIEKRIARDTADYNAQIRQAYAEDKAYLIDNITAEYERQVDLKMQELEIAQEELDVVKKQTQLRNVLAEKNIRQIVERDGKLMWEWVADNEKVRSATEELADAEYELQVAKDKKNQLSAVDQAQENIDDLNDLQEENNKLLELFNTNVSKVTEAVKKLLDPAKSLGEVISSIRGSISSAFSNAQSTKSSSGGGYSGGSSGGNLKTSSYGVSYDPDNDYLDDAQDALYRGDYTGAVVAITKRNAKIDAEGLSYDKITIDKVKPIKSTKKGYASGTRNATKGWHEVNELGRDETYIARDGIFHNFGGGEVVFNPEQTQFLYDLSNQASANYLDKNLIKNLGKDMQSTNISTATRKTYNFGDIVVNNPQDVNDFARQLKQAFLRKGV